MVVDRKPTTEAIGRIVADVVREDDAVRELWVTQDCEGFIISIFTDDIDSRHEVQLYEVADAVHRHFPEALFETHVRNPVNYRFDSFEAMRDKLLPPGARKIQLTS